MRARACIAQRKSLVEEKKVGGGRNAAVLRNIFGTHTHTHTRRARLERDLGSSIERDRRIGWHFWFRSIDAEARLFTANESNSHILSADTQEMLVCRVFE